MKLRVGVVGLGPSWERRYLPALRALSDRFEVRAICEPVALRAEQVARELAATSVDGFRALTRREDVDAVLVLSRHWYGSFPILAACDASKAVYCCDGLEQEPAAAERLKQRVESSGIAFMAEFPRRHAPATLRLKELIATRLGPPRLLFCHLRRPAEEPGNGTALECHENGSLHDLVELVDWCRYVVDREPASVVGVAHDRGRPFFESDYEMLSLEFPPAAGGPEALAQVSCGRYIRAAWPEAVQFRPPAALQVQCAQGVAFVDLPTTVVWFDEAGRHVESLESERPVGEAMLLQFHRSVTSLVRQTSSLQDAYRSLLIAFAARRSHESGQRVPLEF